MNVLLDVLSFMDIWAQNILDQGWLEVAKKQKGAQTHSETSEQ